MKRWPSAFFPKSQKARVFLAVLLFLITPSILFLLFSKRTEPSVKNIVYYNNRAAGEAELARLNQDNDHDGLKDWEEQIYGTDPKKADTDEDKTLDGEEIKLNRDPLKPGPKDQRPEPLTEKKETPAAEENNLTQKFIDKFGEKFVRSYLDNPSANIDNTKLSQEILKDLPADISYPTYFIEKDIITLKKDTPENFSNYLKEFNAIISGSFGNLPQSEIIIFSEALQAEDLSRLSILELYLSAYQIALTKLRSLPVPPAFTNLHLAYLNATKRQQAAVEKMRKADNDIIKGTYGAREYMAAGNEIANIEQKLQKVSNEKVF